MIKRLRIKNFKSYRDSEFEFGKVNIVVGPNGSGKTNLVDAFSFLKQLITPLSYPPYPFMRWGDYKTLYLCKTRIWTYPLRWKVNLWVETIITSFR
ncbi:AAA family ATPase [Saccharolobus islandicus]|uniref:AAA family ATPase n=1 Tax=Saccharolobus islandicus TaxID=43080 RepID=UPI000A56D9FD|nr:AAA family ATPase [Sulfolobus islandicus]